jgi:hypothetical protein
MRLPHIVKFALFCGPLVTLAGQSVQAQTPNSTRFVQLLLLNQQMQINADSKALGTLQTDIARLEAATNPRQIRSLSATISRLNRKIVMMTAELILLSTQSYNTARGLTPHNPTLVSTALSNLLIVQSLSAQVGLGISPATPTQ